jgi:hypothetical protein
MNGWAFFNDNGKSGSGQMVFGPTGQPLGAGSAELTLTGSADGYTLATRNHDGTLIASIVKLDYSTYTRNGNAISLDLTVYNTNLALPFPGYHRLVFEPVNNGTVMPNTWQRWTPTGLAARWWVTQNKAGVCTQSSPCTWAEIRGYFSTSTIRGDLEGGVHLKAGSGWSLGQYNVDAFLFAATVPLTGVLYDFEPETNND